MDKNYYTRKDIESYLQNIDNIEVDIFNNFNEMIEQKILPNVNCENINEYTDGMFDFNDSVCYLVRGKIFPDNQFGTNLIFIYYNKDNIPTAMFEEDSWAKGYEKLQLMVNKSLDFLNK